MKTRTRLRSHQKPLTPASSRASATKDKSRQWSLSLLGPGLITGAADDDPGGIATYSQVGAQFGFSLGWTMIFSYPLMAVMQGISAGIGAVTGEGVSENLRRHYPPIVLRVAVILLLCANLVNIGADLNAMAAALQLLVPGSTVVYSLGFGLVCVVLEVFISYRKYVKGLRWMTLSLFSYVGVVLAVDVPWRLALTGAFVPQLDFDRDHATAVVALLGTTISPYLFFWQAGEEVEELHRRGRESLRTSPDDARFEIHRIRLDTLAGMGFSNGIALFIIFASAATLHPAGILHIETAAVAAQALRPLAGDFAFMLFAAGIIGSGMLAVPVLAGSSAYAVAESFQWPVGLDRRPLEAKGFYGTIGICTLGSIALSYIGIDAMTALYLSAILNGIIATPLMFLMLAIARNSRIMGQFTAPSWMIVVGYATAFISTSATLGLFFL